MSQNGNYHSAGLPIASRVTLKKRLKELYDQHRRLFLLNSTKLSQKFSLGMNFPFASTRLYKPLVGPLVRR